MKFKQSFGETVKQLREERNLTLREVAEHLQIDVSMLSKIEKNNRRASKQLIERIARFFNVKDTDLKITFLSDKVAYDLMGEDFAHEVLKVAEKKVKYLISQKTS